MKIHNVAQGTREWNELRAGIPTASAMDLVITPSGKPSKSQDRYLCTLLAERLLGEPLEDIKTSWMHRGNQVEAEARAYYELQRDCVVETVGFLTTDDGRVGASPDGFVGDDGLVELKSPSPWVHVGYLIGTEAAGAVYRVQCQTQLYVSERNWVDVCSYCASMPEALIRVERDDDFIKALAREVAAFNNRLDELYADLLAKGYAKTPTKRVVSVVDLMRDSLTAAQESA